MATRTRTSSIAPSIPVPTWSTFDRHIRENIYAFSRLYSSSLTLARINELGANKELSALHSYKILTRPYAVYCLIEACKLIGLQNDTYPSVLKEFQHLHGINPDLQQIFALSIDDFNMLRKVRNRSVAHRTEASAQNYRFAASAIFPVVNKIGIYLMYLAKECMLFNPTACNMGLLHSASLFGTHPFIRERYADTAIELDVSMFTKNRPQSKAMLSFIMTDAIDNAKLELGVP